MRSATKSSSWSHASSIGDTAAETRWPTSLNFRIRERRRDRALFGFLPNWDIDQCRDSGVCVMDIETAYSRSCRIDIENSRYRHSFRLTAAVSPLRVVRDSAMTYPPI